MTDQEITDLFRQLIKLSKEDNPGQVFRVMDSLSMFERYDFLGVIAGITLLTDPKFGKDMRQLDKLQRHWSYCDYILYQ